MPLKKNENAPSFELASTAGTTFKLNAYIGEPMILFFYPKNFTTVCTKEVCEFRDAFSEFKGLDIKVFGISQDTIASHQQFKKEFKLPFELLSDPKGKVARMYKATIPVLGMNRRVTYLLGKDHKVNGVFEDMFSAGSHIKAMIKEVQNV